MILTEVRLYHSSFSYGKILPQVLSNPNYLNLKNCASLRHKILQQTLIILWAFILIRNSKLEQFVFPSDQTRGKQ